MPLSEFYRMARGNLESARQGIATNSSDPSHIPENECLELVWENGQILMQSQTNKARRSPSSSNLETQYQKDLGNPTTSKMGLDQDDDDDDMVPWMNYPMEDYCSGLLPEISGLTVATQNSLSSMDKRKGSQNTHIPTSLSLEQPTTSKQELGQSSRSSSCQVYPNSRMPGIIGGNSMTTQPSPGESPMMKTQKQDSGLPNISSSFMNFSHFSRPVALARANLHKATAPSGSNVAEPTQLNSRSGLAKEARPTNQLKDSNRLVARPIEESHTTNQSGNVRRDDTFKNGKVANEIHGESAIRGMHDGEKNAEIAVASSSASGSSLERASNELKQNLKRKYRETDDSEGRSEDIGDSVGIRKTAHPRGALGSKRGRAAEVHNLSERRRRDRINEKMRALQELIPNCNKVDKASMLDEAIEYLKTLQLQVQIMSMGSGMYMPSMMVPAGMQHMHAAHMAQFSPMALGMGMNMGFGAGMMEMSGGSHPMMHLPRMSTPHFAASRPSPISGPMGFQGMVGTKLQGFGHPSQGFPVSAPPRMSHAVQAPNLAPPSAPKEFLQKTNSQMIDNADGSGSKSPEPNEPTSDGLEQPTLLAKNNQSQDAAHGEDVGTRLK